MKVSVRCPHCGTAYRVEEEKLGSHAQCKRCAQTFTLTASGAADETVSGRATPGSDAELRQEYAWPPDRVASVPDAPISEEVSPPAPADEADAPRTIAHYIVKRKLGAGTMGEVWLCHDPDLGRDVAIKLLPASLAKDQQRLKRFLREARAAARLDHANVVAVHQAGADGQRAFIVMQYVDGGSLDKAVAARGPLAWREATQVIRDAAAGLSAAHEMGLVHRDVKPANLMRTTTGATKVVDFGLVRGGDVESHVTQDGRSWARPPSWHRSNGRVGKSTRGATCIRWSARTTIC